MASRCRTGPANGDVTPGSGLAMWPGASGRGSVRSWLMRNTSSWASRAAARALTRNARRGFRPGAHRCRGHLPVERAASHQARRAGQADDGGGSLVGDDLVEAVVESGSGARLELRLHHRRLPAQPAQAEFFLESYDLDGVFHLDLPDSEVARRVLARRLCAGCGMDYSLIDNSPSTEGRCDACGGELLRREDDTEEALAVRLREYHAKTNPVLDIFRRKEYVITVDSRPPREQVQQAIRDKLELPPSRLAAASSRPGAQRTGPDTDPDRAGLLPRQHRPPVPPVRRPSIRLTLNDQRAEPATQQSVIQAATGRSWHVDQAEISARSDRSHGT